MDDTRRRACIARALTIARCEGFVVGVGGIGTKDANPYSREESNVEAGCEVSWARGYQEGRWVYIGRLIEARIDGLRVGHRRLPKANPYQVDSEDHCEQICAQVWLMGYDIGRNRCFRLTHRKLTSTRRDWSCVGHRAGSTRL